MKAAPKADLKAVRWADLTVAPMVDWRADWMVGHSADRLVVCSVV